MQIEEILIIKHDNISYGIDTADIDQILRVPELTPLALGPKEVRGLSAIGGDIVTVLDLARLLGLDSVDKTAFKSRLLTLTEGCAHSALLVSEVVDTVTVVTENIEWVDEPQDAVCAIYRYEDEIVQVLELGALTGWVKMRHYEEPAIKEGSANSGNGEQQSTGASERFLLFSMSNERYAINIEILREIIAIPESYTRVAGSNPEVRGIISLRQELLLIADLRTYYGFDAAEREKNRILVARINDKNIGLVVDDIVDIRDYPLRDVEMMPEQFRDKKVSGVIHDDERLISLIGEEVLAVLVGSNEKHMATRESEIEEEKSDTAMEVVVFRLGEEEYAINIEDVAEIIDNTAVTPVADAPALISGVINIRGQVVAIGSLHKRLGLRECDVQERKVIVCKIGEKRIGFFVDSVSDVMEVPYEAIRDEEEKGELFSSILQLEGGRRLVLLFDTEKIIA